LEEAVRASFLLDYPRQKGTLRQHLKAARRSSDLFEKAKIPRGFESWVTHFLKLRTGESITHQEILAYCTLYSIHLSPLQIDTIMAMDRAASAAISEILKEESGNGGN
jgi:hypothetical protein